MILQGMNLPVHVTASGAAFTGPCSLHSINVNTKAAVASAISVYDGIDNTGTLLAVIDGTINMSYIFDAALQTGVYIAISAGTPDLTVNVMRGPMP